MTPAQQLSQLYITKDRFIKAYKPVLLQIFEEEEIDKNLSNAITEEDIKRLCDAHTEVLEKVYTPEQLSILLNLSKEHTWLVKKDLELQYEYSQCEIMQEIAEKIGHSLAESLDGNSFDDEE